MRIGVDLGGTKTEAVLLNAAGKVLERCRVPTPVDEGYPSILVSIVQLVQYLESQAGAPCQVGIGTPGAIDHRGLIKNANTVCLNGRPLQADLARELEREVRLANDADCFALSEAIDGAGKPFFTVFGVILGTGVGGGVVVDKRLLRGPNHIAGEWGHNPLHDAGETRACYCGRQNCLETFLSGAGLLLTARKMGAEVDSVQDLVARFNKGDQPSRVALERYADQLARGLAGVINILDPEVIILGGGLSNIDCLYRDVPGRLTPYVFSEEVRTPILKAVHGDSSGVLGAADLWV